MNVTSLDARQIGHLKQWKTISLLLGVVAQLFLAVVDASVWIAFEHRQTFFDLYQCEAQRLTYRRICARSHKGLQLFKPAQGPGVIFKDIHSHSDTCRNAITHGHPAPRHMRLDRQPGLIHRLP
jgi:hypothetical protein